MRKDLEEASDEFLSTEQSFNDFYKELKEKELKLAEPRVQSKANGPLYEIWDKVRTKFGLRGIVREQVWGPDRGWGHKEWYYLVKQDGYKPHWVLETEIGLHY